MTAIRLPVSLALALCVTASLFWFLAVLVAVDPEMTFVRTVRGIDFTTKIPEPEVEKRPRVKPTIAKPERREVPVVTVQKNVDLIRGTDPSRHELTGEQIGGDLKGPLVDGPRELAKLTGSDHGPVPEVRMPPDYPASAKERGIEGWITFQFTVAKDGSAKDVVILDSDPPRVWDSATLRAVSSWRYQPAMRDGRPVEQVGVKVTYRYELER